MIANLHGMKTYFIQNTTTLEVKIGKSIDPAKRMIDLQSANGSQLVMRGYLEGDRESEFHSRFSATRLKGEWFRHSSYLELCLRDEFGETPRVLFDSRSKGGLIKRSPVVPRVYVRKLQTKRRGMTYHLRWICPHEKKWKSRKADGVNGKSATQRSANLQAALLEADLREQFG